MSDVYTPGIGISAGALMVKWNILDKEVGCSDVRFNPGETVDVFINLESVLRNLTLQKGIANKVNYYKQDVVIEMESAILNLMAHYRSYFKKLNTHPRMFFYYTDLKSEREQQMKVYNKYYRDTYINKYTQNPQHRVIGELMTDTIIPEISLILQYINECYMLKADGFDGSILPLVVARHTGNRSVIVSGDLFDTLYLFNPNFMVLYVKRRFAYLNVCACVDEVVDSILKETGPYESTIFNSEMYYRLLIAVKGSTIRNIKGAFGMGEHTLVTALKKGLDNGLLLSDFSSLESILELFPEKFHECLLVAFRCTDLEIQYGLLSDTDKNEVICQIVDKVDTASVESLNNRRFLNNPINLPELLT